MIQLELRSYPRAEIAEILSVNINDSGHFKRNVERKLNKLGYGYHYETASVEILSLPNKIEDPQKRLAALLINTLGLDVQINPVQFACFIAAFNDIEDFHSMPWEEREDAMYKKYGFLVCAKTMSNWAKKLMACGVIEKFGASTAWRTEIFQGIKYRTPVDDEMKEGMKNYFARRKALFNEYYQTNLENYVSSKEAYKAAWSKTYKTLWDEFSCCYYWCKNFEFSAFTAEVEYETLQEIYELAHDIAGVAS